MKLTIAFSFLVYFLCISISLAQSVTLPWMAPTEFTDDSPLDPLTHLTGYGIYQDGVRVRIAAPGTLSYTIPDVGSFGSHEFYVTAIAKNGAESAMSNVLVRDYVDNRVPKPPTLLDAIFAWVKRFFGWFA